jgi:hypothetical protein
MEIDARPHPPRRPGPANLPAPAGRVAARGFDRRAID